jgi:hypothetical protein
MVGIALVSFVIQLPTVAAKTSDLLLSAANGHKKMRCWAPVEMRLESQSNFMRRQLCVGRQNLGSGPPYPCLELEAHWLPC